MLEHVEDSSPDVHVCVDGSAESFLPFTFPSKYINTSSYQNQCFTVPFGSGSGRVVKLLACGARGPGFDSPPRHLDFQRLVISCFQVAIWLKYR